MTTEPDLLLEVVTRLTMVDRAAASRRLAAPGPTGDRLKAWDTLLNLVRQVPASPADRAELIGQLESSDAELATERVRAAADLLRSNPPRYPDRGVQITLPALDPDLGVTLRTLADLHRTVLEPWTVVGGLMVMLHCAEHLVPFGRVTADADVAVGVFTHRTALARLTSRLTALGFSDATPRPLTGGETLSYRWARDRVLIDLMVPLEVNRQRRVPRTVVRSPVVELPATQQALARSELIHFSSTGDLAGTVRRPDLLGALIMKAVAVVADRRDPARHAADLVTLSEVLAFSGRLVGYARELRPKDKTRLSQAYVRLTDRDWRRCAEPGPARAALGDLVDGDRSSPTD